MMRRAQAMSTVDDNTAGIMQKRRISAFNKDHILPLTEGDTQESRRIRKKPMRSWAGATFFWAAIVMTVVALALFVGKSITTDNTFTYNHDKSRSLPLSKFETVNNALQHANLVALYFAASWCPMSTPITNLLEETFSTVPNLLYASGNVLQKRELAIVHVSSDTSESAMLDYLRPGWIAVPFDSPEQTALKRHFSVCAKRELQQLEMERKFEIPTLIILDGETQGIITTNAVTDLKTKRAQALDHWIELQQIIRRLESKYSSTI